MIKYIKTFFADNFHELKKYYPVTTDLKNFWNYFLIFNVALIFLIQFSVYSSILFNTAESRPIVASVDDDTQEAIRLTQNTYILNDNGARAYGPIYYRLASVAQYFGANSYSNFELTKKEQFERSAYFTMMLINLLAIFLYCYLLASLIHPQYLIRVIITMGLVHTFMSNDLRSALAFMGKPDHLLVLFISWAFVVTWQWLKDFENRKLIIKSAAAWGLAASTKLSTLFFAPGILSLWLFKKINTTKWTFFYFLKWLIIFYFVFGFPQNFDVSGYLSYLIHQNSFTSLVSWEFFTEKWLRLFSNDLQLPFIFLLVAVPFFHHDFSPNETDSSKQKIFNQIHLILFCLITFIVVTHKQTRAPFEWYTFPVTNIMLIGFVIIYNDFLSFLFKKLKGKFSSRFLKPIGSMSFRIVFSLVLIINKDDFFPSAFHKQHLAFKNCRQEARQFMKEINDRAATGAMFLADAAVPYDHQYHDKNIFMKHEMKTSHLNTYKPKYVALKKVYYQIYLPKAEGGSEAPVTHISNPEDTRNFYRTYFNKDMGTDVNGDSWKKIYSDACTFELWEKINPIDPN